MEAQNIIFDLDGTLVHSAPDLRLATNEMLVQMGRRELSLEEVTGFIGNGVEKLVERALRATGGEETELHGQAMMLFRASYTNNLTTLTQPYTGVVEVLQTLKDAGVAMAICTNKPEAMAVTVCDSLGLSGFFTAIVGATDGVAKKPAPASLDRAIAAIGGHTAQSVYVGDSETDFLTAVNGSVPFLLFSGGYLKAPLEGLEASRIFDHWSEFESVLAAT